jgi:hypothetical protein
LTENTFSFTETSWGKGERREMMEPIVRDEEVEGEMEEDDGERWRDREEIENQCPLPHLNSDNTRQSECSIHCTV